MSLCIYHKTVYLLCYLYLPHCISHAVSPKLHHHFYSSRNNNVLISPLHN